MEFIHILTVRINILMTIDSYSILKNLFESDADFCSLQVCLLMRKGDTDMCE